MTNITVSLETAKKLNETGRQKETLFSYGDDRNPHKRYNCPPVGEFEEPNFIPFWNVSSSNLGKSREQGMLYGGEIIFGVSDIIKENIYRSDNAIIQAPTAEEILDELPKIIDTDSYLTIRWFWLVKTPQKTTPVVGYRGEGKELLVRFENKSLVEALATLRLRCKENGYLDTLPKE